MLKIIEFIFILLSGISLIIIASLFNGIEIENFFYKNINIKKLYLKYDKNLNISAQKIIFNDENAKEQASIKTSFSIDYKDGVFVVDMQKFFLQDTDLEVTGLVYIDPHKINFDTTSEMLGKNLILTFDKKMKKVKAQTVFATFKNNSIDLSFQKPYYDDVLLKGSKVSYLMKEDTLQLYLKTQSLFNDTIKGALARYDIDIDTIQYDGTNDISTNIFIPFDDRNVFVEVDAHILNSNLEDFGYKYKVNESTLNYKNFLIKGTTDLNHIEHKDMKIDNSIFTYEINIENDLKINIHSEDINATKDKYNFQAKNTSLQYENDKIIFSSDISDDDNKTHISLNNITDIKTKELLGTLNLTYDDKDNNVSISGKNFNYKGDFKDDLNISIEAKNIKVIKPYKSNINNLSIQLQKDELKSHATLTNKKDTYRLNIKNTTNLTDKISYGNIGVEKFIFKDILDISNKNIPYQTFFEDNIIFNSAIFGLTYFKEINKNKASIIISNPNKLLEPLKFLNVDKNSNGFIEIETDNFTNTIVNIEDLNINMNKEYFASEKNTNTDNVILPQFPKIDLTYKNSNIKYDTFTLFFDTLKLHTNKDDLQVNIKKEDAQIDIDKKANRIMINGTKLNDKYINNLLNKEILEEGYIDVNIYGDNINDLSGDFNLYDTTVKNVTLINSLSTFVNTTPAIINPLLALPTLFRLAETGFDTNGYYLKHGDGSFRYKLPKNELEIYDLYTNGKMSNFIVNSHTNLSTKKIDANVDISFLKDFTTTLNYIPLVGYIIMGEDGEFHTSVDITGTTDDPTLETHTVKEASRGVTGIIKRILTLPLQPFKIKVTEEQIKEHNKRVETLLNGDI